MSQTEDDPAALAGLCARILDQQKMADIKVFDVREATQVMDCLVISTGRNPRHLKAASDALFKELRGGGIGPKRLEGYREGRWIVVDLIDVVVHMFLEESRKFYDLELLWGDSPSVEWRMGTEERAAQGAFAGKGS